MPKTSLNITRYLYFRGPVRQVFLQRARDELDWSYDFASSLYLALRARQNTAQLVKILGDTTQQNV